MTDLASRSLRLGPRPDHISFVMDKEALGHAVLLLDYFDFP